MHEEMAARAEQLRKGVAGAAAALPAGEAALGERALEAVDLLVSRLRDAPSAPSGDEEGRAAERMAEGVALLERLHYHLVKAAVLGGSSAEAELSGEVEEVRGATEEVRRAAEGLESAE